MLISLSKSNLKHQCHLWSVLVAICLRVFGHSFCQARPQDERHEGHQRDVEVECLGVGTRSRLFLRGFISVVVWLGAFWFPFLFFY